MAGKKRILKSEVTKEETIAHAFWRGFFWPFRAVGRLLVWLSHKPPLKQIGHLLRWVANMRVVKFIAKITGIRYVVRSWRELKLVTWPKFRDSLRLVSAVLIFSVVFGLFVAVLDYGLDKLFKQVILK